jgi:four helix bundle protein
MQERPTHRSFLVLDCAIQAIEVLRPVVARIRQCDRNLGEQLRRALSSVALNIAEGNSSEGGLRLSRFSSAAGSASEVRAGLRVTVAWGYVSPSQVAAGERLLDAVAAMLHRLGARR